MEYHILASGSKGNSTFIYDNGVGILIDCGISRKQLLYRLQTVGFQEEDIQYVLLSHDHYDHNKNIHIFPSNILYCSEEIMLDESNHILVPYQDITLNHITITPLTTSHDAKGNLAFLFKTEKESLLYMTDTGYVLQKNLTYMKDLNYYIFESNHDVEMLMATNRPIFLKRRIYGDLGHLNNEYSAKIMCDVIGNNTKEIVLAHLSQEANTKEKALETYFQVFKENQISFSNIKVASQVNVVSGGNYHEDKSD